MRKTPKKHVPLRKFDKGIFIPGKCKDLRTLINRMVNGQPLNESLAEHQPLPPDGMNADDFDTGTREVLDLIDQQELANDVKSFREQKLRERAAAAKQAPAGSPAATASEVENSTQAP